MTQLTLDEQDRFLQEMASLARSGLPLPQGLRQLASGAEHERIRALSGQIAQSLESGKMLSQAMRETTIRVPPQLIAIIECGETAGELSPILQFALEQARRIRAHRSAILTSLVYPSLVLVTMVLTICFILVNIIPRFEEIYSQTRVVMPFFSGMLVKITHVINAAGIISIALLLVVLLVLPFFVPQLRDFLFVFVSKLPGMRHLIVLSDTSLIMKFIERMGSRRVPMPIILRAASFAVWSRRTQIHLQKMSEAAERGQPITPLLDPLMPATAAWLFSQGEERGDLPKTCGGIAEYCNDRFERLSKRSIAVLEPVFILIVALIIAYVIVGLYIPLYSLPRSITNQEIYGRP